MKILFAVNNDNISETVMKKYQSDYKEMISYKNVYYFNAILKELQNDKSYDRIVISEDLEPFANNNYDTIDKFLFEKLEKISEEATKANGEKIEIILICADRRTKSDEMLKKIFGIGIYDALIEDDRTIDNLCILINQPRTKKEAQRIYKIEAALQGEDENGVSEAEVQNILVHYKRLGKNEDKYVDSFNNIVSQYTDTQLRIIIKYLPLHVKAVLEEKSPKYQQLATFSIKHSQESETYVPRNLKNLKQEEKLKVQMLNEEKQKITRPIVIPSELDNKKAVKLEKTNKESEDIIENIDVTPKKGRGRPRKNPQIQEEQENKPKRGRGRPKKEVINENNEDEFDIDLFNIDVEEENNKNVTPGIEELEFDLDLFNMGEEDEVKDSDTHSEPEESINLLGFEEEQEGINLLEDEEEQDDIDLYNIEESEIDSSVDNNNQNADYDFYNEDKPEENNYIEPRVRTSVNLNSLITNEKKIVSFVGTTKNGTSFVVNNLGLILSQMNISTAILDMTQNKNSYYIFTNNDEKLRRIAEKCILNLENGIAEGIKVDRNLTVYTQMPGREKNDINVENILGALLEKHDIVLIDTDFNTSTEVFANCQEIYLVQSMDILTIQPLTAFLRNLKSKNILRQEKIKIVINKEQKVRSLSDKILIGGISCYNDPSMTLMTELFDKDNVKYCKIPFEVQNYAKYLDTLVNCELSLRGYTKSLITGFNELAEMVYPLLNKTKYSSADKRKNRMEFSDDTRNTLNKMRRNY